MKTQMKKAISPYKARRVFQNKDSFAVVCYTNTKNTDTLLYELKTFEGAYLDGFVYACPQGHKKLWMQTGGHFRYAVSPALGTRADKLAFYISGRTRNPF